MPPGQALEPSLTESSFLATALSQGIRPDGRSFTQSRDISIQFGEELGSCSVEMGGTRVTTSTRATLVAPRSDRPYEGFLHLTTDISPMAGPEYDTSSGATSSARTREILFDRLLDKALRRTDAIDRESLCIVAGRLVFQIHLTVHLLADCGAAVDAAVLAAMASLRQFRRPEVEVDEGKVRVYGDEERVGVPLAVHHSPLCVSFAMFQVGGRTDRTVESGQGAGETTEWERDEAEQDALHPGEGGGGEGEATGPHAAAPTARGGEGGAGRKTVALLDPARLEETLAEARLTLVLNAQREICVLDKAGGAPLEADKLLETLQLGLARVRELSERLERELKRDAEVRVVEVV